jgi:hypothetical protein
MHCSHRRGQRDSHGRPGSRTGEVPGSRHRSDLEAGAISPGEQHPPSDPEAEGGVCSHGTVRQGTSQSPPSRDHGATRHGGDPRKVGPTCISGGVAEPRPTRKGGGAERENGPPKGGTTRRAVQRNRPPGALGNQGTVRSRSLPQQPGAHTPSGRARPRGGRGPAGGSCRPSRSAIAMALRHERARSGSSCSVTARISSSKLVILHSCDRPGERCQGDHVQAWTAGGTTTVDNGQLRCGFHNRWRWQHPDPPPDPTCAGESPISKIGGLGSVPPSSPSGW